MPKFVAKTKPILLLIVSVFCFVVGFGLLWQRYRATTGPAPAPKASQTVTETTTRPTEAKPTQQAADTYTVPADQPRSITLPSISATGLVQKVGLTKDNAVAAPNNINFAGWFSGSVPPGQLGLSIIDGHVSGKYADGVFKKLQKLKAGDQFSVEFGDKSVQNFSVVSVASVPEAQASAALFNKQSDIPQQLNLITCGGTFNRATQQYNDRVIVVAKLIQAIPKPANKT